jgi:hypothetical protein
MPNFMSIGVFTIYSKMLLAFSPNMFEGLSAFSVHAKILLAYLETTSIK